MEKPKCTICGKYGKAQKDKKKTCTSTHTHNLQNKQHSNLFLIFSYVYEILDSASEYGPFHSNPTSTYQIACLMKINYHVNLDM